MARIGIVTGLKSELRAAAAAGTRTAMGTSEIRCAAADAGRARDAARQLVAAGVHGLASFGTAGALSHPLRPGTILLPRAIHAVGAAPAPCDPAWRERLSLALAEAVRVAEDDLAGSPELLDSSASKSALRAATGAGAADMESRAVAEVAMEARIPFVAVRAIADPASRAPTMATLALIAPDGGIRLTRAGAALLRHPSSIPLFCALGFDSARAHRALRRVALLCGPLLRFV